MVGVKRLDRAPDRLGHHYHTRATAEGIVVAFQMLILGVVANIHDIDFNFLFLLRTAEYAFL